MDSKNIDQLLDNEKEWRRYLIKNDEKLFELIDGMRSELSSFKLKVLTVAAVVGTGSGLGSKFVIEMLLGAT